MNPAVNNRQFSAQSNSSQDYLKVFTEKIKHKIAALIRSFGPQKTGDHNQNHSVAPPQTRRHNGDFIIVVLSIILAAAGLMVIFAIGPLRANFLNSINPDYHTDTSSFFTKQLLMVVIAVIVATITYSMPIKTIQRFSRMVLAAGIISCLLLTILAIAHVYQLARCELGACRWFKLGMFGFQPAELLKLGLVLFFASFFAEHKKAGTLGKTSDFWFIFATVSAASLFFTVVAQKDLGTGASLMAIILAMFFSTGIKIRKFAIVLAIVALGGIFAIVKSPHRIQRLMTFSGSSGSDTYHIENALLAIGTGGLFGVGIGNSVQATGYLPESINDSVFAVMGETFGFVGLTGIMLAFFVLLWRLMDNANKMFDNEKRYVFVGAYAWLGSQVAINIMSMTGLIPLTGITLPLLSYGGTSIIFTAIILGLCFSLSRYTERRKLTDAEVEPITPAKNSNLRQPYPRSRFLNTRGVQK